MLRIKRRPPSSLIDQNINPPKERSDGPWKQRKPRAVYAALVWNIAIRDDEWNLGSLSVIELAPIIAISRDERLTLSATLLECAAIVFPIRSQSIFSSPANSVW